MTKVKLGFSTCPNDTFMFDAMVHGKIDTEGLEFDLLMADIEKLNNLARGGELDVTKLSFFTFLQLSNDFALLHAGSALGNGNGPLLVSKQKIYPDEVNDLHIAIPGFHTTANLLLSIAYPKATNKTEYLFSDIEEAVCSNEVDAGLIIHESRFTYPDKGLKKIADMGEYWENLTHLPIPLGGIAVKRIISDEIKAKLNRVMHRSVVYALKNPDSPLDFVREYAQEMSEEVMYKHIGLYVNDYSADLGEKGIRAIETLGQKALEMKLISSLNESLF